MAKQNAMLPEGGPDWVPTVHRSLQGKDGVFVHTVITGGEALSTR
jgi:hypothetical protein